MLACPLCGAPHCTCGPPYVGTPVDTPTAYKPKEDAMDLAEYDVIINGQPTTALLTPAQAQRLGATPVAAKQGEGEAQPKAKARKPANK